MFNFNFKSILYEKGYWQNKISSVKLIDSIAVNLKNVFLYKNFVSN